MEVPFFDLGAQVKQYRSSLHDSLDQVIDSGQFIGGELVNNFEDSFAKYLGVDHCVGVGNGLDALRLCLEVNNIGPGDEVIVPAFTFYATWLAILQVGATPVPVDVGAGVGVEPGVPVGVGVGVVDATRLRVLETEDATGLKAEVFAVICKVPAVTVPLNTNVFDEVLVFVIEESVKPVVPADTVKSSIDAIVLNVLVEVTTMEGLLFPVVKVEGVAEITGAEPCPQQ
jgi:hypothetical protein